MSQKNAKRLRRLEDSVYVTYEPTAVKHRKSCHHYEIALFLITFFTVISILILTLDVSATVTGDSIGKQLYVATHTSDISTTEEILHVMQEADALYCRFDESAGAVDMNDGRLPGDDIPATERCYMTEEEVREDYENQKISEAMLAKANKIENCTVTHYDCCVLCCGKTDGITASGVKATPGVTVAVDTSIIPLGSDVLVDYGDGVINYYRADDTGSAIKGNNLDLCVSNHQEAINLGVRTATVYWVDAD